MTSIDGALLDFKRLDQLAQGNTSIHRLDPRAKVLATVVFIVSVISYGKYELTALLPFFLFPVFMVAFGNLPLGYVVKKILLLCPFVLMVGIFNPFIDRVVLVQLGPFGVTGGMISFASIIIRAALTVGISIVLVSVTGFPNICRALERMGMPRVFAVQLLFLHRYIFVLTEEGGRVSRARQLRSFGGKGLGIKTHGSLLGHFLLRTWLRAERIHMAMLARGFAGKFHSRHEYRFGGSEILFLFGWSTLFITFRLYNGSQLLGSFLTGIFP
jgi:cobalt/nickel transport system permease protein